ncbi:MAG: hypothetical protein HY842_20190 [Bacteroidetes bacterium]|nr:hypothetical protein [Bacteroidota bacterium]
MDIDSLKALLELFKDFLRDLGMEEWLVQVVSTMFTGLILLTVVAFCLNWVFKKFVFWNDRRRLNRDLHPFYTKAEIDKATRYYIPTKYQDTAPSQAEEPSRSFIDSPKAKLIPMMLKKGFVQDDNRYYLILADSGMGKTTFMMNLGLAYKNQFFWKKKHDIRLLPLGHPKALTEVEKIQDQENTILLLDALDEDVEAVKNYKKRLGEILEKTWRFREVVITCRTQFFPNETEELSSTGYFRYGTDGGEHFFRKAYVSVFDDKDINRYLGKRFKFYQWKSRRKARRIVQKSPNLMVRPMLLSYIRDLVDGKSKYEYTYQIYEVLIQKWIEREADKPGIEAKYGSKEIFKQKLMAFSQDFAKNLYFQRDKRNGRLSIPFEEPISTSSGIQLTDYEEEHRSIKEIDWRNRSLLNRDADGRYKFSHKSILEYILAKEALSDIHFFQKLDFKSMDAAMNFCTEMLIHKNPFKIDGKFSLKDSSIELPLSTLKPTQWKQLETMTIKNAHSIPFSSLFFLLKNNLKTITVFDHQNFSVLYDLYLYKYFKKLYEKGWIDREKLYEIMNGQDVISILDNLQVANTKELRQRLIILDALDIKQFLDFLLKIEINELRDKIEREGKGVIEIKKYMDFYESMKYPKESLVNKLDLVNNFISECKFLEKNFPYVKIIY